jgi:hypothetical protein
MGESTRWEIRRYATLLAVVALHLGFVAVLLMTPPAGSSRSSTVQPVEVLFLPPPNPPKVRVASAPSRRLSVDTAITSAPPVLDSPSSSMRSSSASSSDGSGSGVDWAAEARRAVQAFDIRQHQPASRTSVSGRPGEDTWWPHAPHHAGDQFKTANGDWIVWINANCYQIASSGPSASAQGAAPPQTICREPPGLAK